MRPEKDVVKDIVKLAIDLGKRQAYLEVEQRKPASKSNEREQEEKIKNMRTAMYEVRYTIDTIIDTVF